MHRRNLLLGGAGLMMVAGCASAGMGGVSGPNALGLAEEAPNGRALVPSLAFSTTHQPWTYMSNCVVELPASAL